MALTTLGSQWKDADKWILVGKQICRNEKEPTWRYIPIEQYMWSRFTSDTFVASWDYNETSRAQQTPQKPKRPTRQKKKLKKVQKEARAKRKNKRKPKPVFKDLWHLEEFHPYRQHQGLSTDDCQCPHCEPLAYMDESYFYDDDFFYDGPWGSYEYDYDQY